MRVLDRNFEYTYRWFKLNVTKRINSVLISVYIRNFTPGTLKTVRNVEKLIFTRKKCATNTSPALDLPPFFFLNVCNISLRRFYKVLLDSIVSSTNNDAAIFEHLVSLPYGFKAFLLDNLLTSFSARVYRKPFVSHIVLVAVNCATRNGAPKKLFGRGARNVRERV